MAKRIINLIVLITSLMLILLSFPVTAFATSEFDVQDGVLLAYNGSSSVVKIPAGVYSIADSAFEGNSSVSSVNLNNASVVGNKAFANCTSLTTITGADSLTSCGAYAFFNTPFLNSYASKALILGSVLVNSDESGEVFIDNTVVSVAPYAFSGNNKVTSVFIGEGVASVGEGAFYNCSALKSVAVSKQVTYIGAFAFEGTPYLSGVKDDFVVLGNGILIDVNSTAAELVIPENVKQISAGALYNNKSIKSVQIPESVTSVGLRAFAGCTSLHSVTLPKTLVLLDKEAFSGCTALHSVTVPAQVKLLGESAFLGCTALETAILMSATDVPEGLFAGCTSLESVMIADGVKRIRSSAFYNCSKLKEITAPASIEYVADNAFKHASDFSVWCKSGSYIEKYCTDNSISAYSIGDANLDGSVNIRDATEIQKATARILVMNKTAVLRGDADFSGEINIRDATEIQKFVAGIV